IYPGPAARRRARDLWRDLYAGGNDCPLGDGRRDPECGGAARRLHDRLHHQCGGDGDVGAARAAAALAEYRTLKVDGAGSGPTEVRVTLARWAMSETTCPSSTSQTAAHPPFD